MRERGPLSQLDRAPKVELGTVMLASLQTNAGSSFLILAVTMEALRISGSAAAAPLIVAASGLAPMLIVRPIRTLIRRFDPRGLMVLADAGGLVVVSALALVITSGLVSQWHLYAAMLLLGGFSALYIPASREWGTRVTADGEQLTALNAVLSISTQLAIVIGWSSGGLLVTFVGPGGAIAICAATYAVSLMLQVVVFSITRRQTRLNRPLNPDCSRSDERLLAWRRMLRDGSSASYTYSLLSQALLQRLTFSMFIPLVAGVSSSDGWVAGVANGGFGVFAIFGALLLTTRRPGLFIRHHAPKILGCCFVVQIAFGLGAGEPALAITLFGAVGLLSVSASAIQSEAQDAWREIGAGDAFSILGAVQAPIQVGGALLLSLVLVKVDVTVVYVVSLAVLGTGSVMFAVVARARGRIERSVAAERSSV